jgi:hypothetical protein
VILFNVTVTKRSADAKTAAYMHFAGKTVLEIAIDNIAELEKFEKKL